MSVRPMSKVRIRANERVLEAMRLKYPFEVRLIREIDMKLKPTSFKDARLVAQFARVPFPDRVYWLFDTSADMAKFKTWAKIDAD